MWIHLYLYGCCVWLSTLLATCNVTCPQMDIKLLIYLIHVHRYLYAYNTQLHVYTILKKYRTTTQPNSTGSIRTRAAAGNLYTLLIGYNRFHLMSCFFIMLPNLIYWRHIISTFTCLKWSINTQNNNIIIIRISLQLPFVLLHH